MADADGSPTTPDGGAADAGMCGAQLLFTGEYVDWDSTPADAMGIYDAQVAAQSNPDGAVSSAPNGRVILCLPASAGSVVTFTHPDYLPVRYTVAPAAVDGPFSIRGLTPARADALFSTELGITRDVAAAQVLVAVRSYPGGTPVSGAQVSIGNQNVSSFTDTGDGTYGPGDTLAGGAFVLFGNVETTGGSTTVSVTPPPGTTCDGPSTIDVAAGEVAVTTFSCAP